MALRRLSIAVRVILAVAVPTLALLGALGVAVIEAARTERQANTELDRLDGLEVLAEVQSTSVFSELAELDAELEGASGSGMLVQGILRATWSTVAETYFEADDRRRALSDNAAALIGADADEAFEDQRAMIEQIVALMLDPNAPEGAALDLAINELPTIRLRADYALTDLSIASASDAWITYLGAVEVARISTVEFAHLLPVLLGLDGSTPEDIASLDGRRANATERVVFSLQAERREDVQAVFESEAFTEWVRGVDAALELADGGGEAWSLAEVADFTATSLRLQAEISAITVDAVGDVRRELADEASQAALRRERVLSLAVGLMAATAILTFWIVRSITRPLRKLTARAARVANGDLGDGVEVVRGSDELARLGRTLEDVAAGLRHLDSQVSAMGAGTLDESASTDAARSAVGAFVHERIEDLRRTNGALRAEAAQDSLTGLLNRRGALDWADLIGQDGVEGRVVLFVDLDRFKEVNDRFGHRHGDAVLQAVGARLTDISRSSDLVARLGGDEFVMVIDGLPDDGVASLISRIESRLAEPIAFDGVEHRVGSSVGASRVGCGDSLSDVIDRADLAMIEVKALHREATAGGSGVRNPR